MRLTPHLIAAWCHVLVLALLAPSVSAAPPGFYAHPGEPTGLTEARALIEFGRLQGKQHTERVHYQCDHFSGADRAACDATCQWPAGPECSFVVTFGARGSEMLRQNPERAGDAVAAAAAAGIPKARREHAALHAWSTLEWDDPKDPMRAKKPLTVAQRSDLLAARVQVSGATSSMEHFRRSNERARVHARIYGSRHPAHRIAQIDAAIATAEASLPKNGAEGLDRHLPALERVLPADHPQLALARARAAETYFWAGRVDEAFELLDASRASLERVYGMNHWALIPALLAEARLKVELEQPIRAVDLVERAFELSVAKHDVWGETSYDVMLGYAHAHFELATSVNDSSFTLALSNLDRLEQITGTAPSRRQLVQRHFLEALHRLGQAQDRAEGLMRPDTELGEAFEVARAKLKDTKKEMDALYGGSNHWYYAKLMYRYGDIFMLAGDPEQAVKTFQLVEDLAELARTPHFVETYRAREARARALAGLKRFDQARALAEGVTAALDEHHPAHIALRARAWRTLALLQWRAGDLSDARASHAKARELVMLSMRSDVGANVTGTELLTYFTRYMVSVHEGLSLEGATDPGAAFDALMELQGAALRQTRDRSAWKRIEARIPDTMLDDLAELRRGEVRGFESAAEEKRLRKTLGDLVPALARAPEVHTRKDVCARLSKERAWLVDYVNMLDHTGFDDAFTRNNPYNGARSGIRIESVFTALVVSPKCEVTRIRLSDMPEMRKRVEAFRAGSDAMEACFEKKGDPRRCMRKLLAMDDAGERLAELVWAPIAEHIDAKSKRKKRKKRKVLKTYVVADDKLLTVPLDGLLQANGRYVVEDVEMTLLPFPLALVEVPRDLVGARQKMGTGSAFVIGNVDYGESADASEALQAVRTCKGGSCEAFEPEEGTLVATRGTSSAGLSKECTSAMNWGALATEALAVSELLSTDFKRDVVFSTGDTATEFVAKLMMPGQRIIHIATHGFFSTSTPCLRSILPDLRNLAQAFVGDALHIDITRLGALVLAGANTGSTDPRNDGFLNGADIAKLDLSQTELVVLSACESSLGLAVAGEGSFGLTRGFILAGAGDVIGALWKVPSKATTELFRDTYTFMLSKKHRAAPSKALRMAKLRALERARASGLPNSAFLWASFSTLHTRP